MEFNEAHSHAMQMAKQGHAFDKIEEVLCTASLAEQATREAEAERVEVKKEITRLSGEKGRLKVEVDALARELQETTEKNGMLRDGMAERLNEHVKGLDEAMDHSVKSHDDAVYALDADLTAKQYDVAKAVEMMDLEKSGAEGELAEMREKVRRFKDSILDAGEDDDG